MALSKTLENNFGFDAVKAYSRVECVSLVNKRIHFHLRAYTKPIGVDAFCEKPFQCDYDFNGANPIAQAYEYLKTLPEFADAVDC